MTDAHDSSGIPLAHAQDLDALQRHAADLTRAAQTATHKYERKAWIHYTAFFLPIPFLVLLFRLHMQAWHYCVAWGLFLGGGVVIYAVDFVAAEKRDRAIQASDRAREAYEIARVSAKVELKSARTK
jgi:hypothetical protein